MIHMPHPQCLLPHSSFWITQTRDQTSPAPSNVIEVQEQFPPCRIHFTPPKRYCKFHEAPGQKTNQVGPKHHPPMFGYYS
jgi:hypothetical protein